MDLQRYCINFQRQNLFLIFFSSPIFFSISPLPLQTRLRLQKPFDTGITTHYA
jgi:hypothetical protein